MTSHRRTRQAGMQDYARERLSHLLLTLADQVQRAIKKPGPDEIHDLRVSIRRFSQGLQLFADFFHQQEIKKIRTMLKRVMRVTSAIRDRDITLEFLAEAGHTTHRPRLEKERVSYQRQFSGMLRRWSARNFSAQWRDGLSLGNV